MMAHSYRSLPSGLHETADAAIDWFIKKWGIPKGKISVEAAFDADINFRPTFVAQTKDKHVLCVEVSGSIYNNTLDTVVLDCREKGLPVKLFVAVPKDISDPLYGKKLKAAKRAGVGVLEVDHASGTVVQQPLALSLSGLRSIELTDFPPRYRQNLQHAHQTFLDGEPGKACALVYDELEGACRLFAIKCVGQNLWNNGNNWDLAKHAWAPLMSALDRTLDRSHAGTKKVTPALCARILGVTTHRNDTGHKPKNAKELMRRDKALRTRFESAVDLLAEFLEATKAFRI